VEVARAGLIIAIAIGLLAGATVGVAAQSDAVEPVGFTGGTQELPGISEDCGLGSTTEVVSGVSQTRGFVCSLWMEVSEPRFTGTITRVGSVDEYRGGDLPTEVSLWVSTMVHRVENDGGTWEGTATTSVTIDDVRDGGEVVNMPRTVAFSGTGDYEGLTAVVSMKGGYFPNVRGVIFEGSPPPSPSE
jgi:hypothetical protein